MHQKMLFQGPPLLENPLENPRKTYFQNKGCMYKTNTTKVDILEFGYKDSWRRK